MSECKAFSELLLAADELQAEQSESLENHLADCESCRRRRAEYRAILSAVSPKEAAHVDSAVLARYVAHRCDPDEADFDGRPLTEAEVQIIENHLDSCATCRESMNLAMADYQEIEAYLEGQGLPETLPAVPAKAGIFERLRSLWRGLGGHGSLVYASGTAAAVILLWISPLFRPEAERYYALASLDHGDVAPVTRGEGSGLHAGLAAFAEERYGEAVDALEEYVRGEPTTETPYARYVLGLAHLNMAKTDFLGRAHRVDTETVDRALAELAAAEQTASSDRLREDALWFTAKAHLLRLDTKAALEALARIDSLDGRRSSPALGLAREIRNLR